MKMKSTFTGLNSRQISINNHAGGVYTAWKMKEKKMIKKCLKCWKCCFQICFPMWSCLWSTPDMGLHKYPSKRAYDIWAGVEKWKLKDCGIVRVGIVSHGGWLQSLLNPRKNMIHSRSGETVGNWVGNQLAAGWTTRLEWGYTSSFWQLPTQKAKTQWATTTTSGGLAIGRVFGSPSKATNACVYHCMFQWDF